MTICLDITDYMKKFQGRNKKEIIKISGDLRKQKERIKKGEEPGGSYHFPINTSLNRKINRNEKYNLWFDY